MSRTSYSRASDCLGNSNRCALYVSQSPMRSTLPYVGGSLAEQPASVMAADDARPWITARRVAVGLFISSADDHRPHVPAETGQHRSHQMPCNEHKKHHETAEVQCRRRLMTTEDCDPA